MASHRHVVLGLARARSSWFANVARWSTSGVLAVDFVKTVSTDEVRARLTSGRPFSALLVDGSIPGIDRDLFDVARERGLAAIVVSDDSLRDWNAAGASAVIPTTLTADDLMTVLSAHSAPIDPLDSVPGTSAPPPTRPAGGFRAQVVSVTGSSGSGKSVVAAAIAQGLAADPAHAGTALLADLALDADQGLLHDAGDVIPGLLELVERHRTGDPTVDAVRSMTFDIVARRYRLLLGLRQHQDWTALRPMSLQAALDALRRAFTIVVADIDDDFEGESETGSVDVEDRNQMARSALSLSDVVVVVGTPGLSGVHGLLRASRRCIEAGFPASNLVPVLNRVPRRGRAEAVTAVNTLLARHAADVPLLSPVVVNERGDVERAVRDGAPLPGALVDPVTAAVRGRLEMAHATAVRMPTPLHEPVPVVAGSLGEWFDEEQV